MPQNNERRVHFNRNNRNNNSNDDDDDFGTELHRPQTLTEDREVQFDQGNSSRAESGRRRSSSDPSGRGRQRPRLAVLRPRGNPAAGPALAHIPEDKRIGSTAYFNAPDGRNTVNPELADVLDVIGAYFVDMLLLLLVFPTYTLYST